MKKKITDTKSEKRGNEIGKNAQELNERMRWKNTDHPFKKKKKTKNENKIKRKKKQPKN